MKLNSRSIAVRLTVGLGLIALIVFVAAGALLQRALAHELAEADRQELRGKLVVVQHFIGEFARAGDTTVLHHHFDDLRIGHSRLSIRVLASDASDVYHGAGLPVDEAFDASGFGRVLRADGAPFDTIQTVLGTDSPWPGGRIVLGLDSRPRDQLLARLRNNLVGVFVLGMTLTAGLSAMATWRGLAPIKRLSKQAGSITAHSLSIRLIDRHDAAELEGLVAAFNAVLDRLETAYRQIEAFSANVAHELRTPLATLVSGSQVMLSRARTASELKEAIASNLEELQQMSQLVNDMLFLARADQGDRARGLEPTELAAEADRTLKYCEPLLEEGGLTAALVGAASIACNPALVRRALVNLLVNAIRHTDSGGRIVVAIEVHGTSVRLSVENPGPPIPEGIKAHMFDRFFRADGARARAGESHGLGLTIVAAIARMHGGTVFAEYTGKANRIGLVIPGQVPSS